jgi:hypothetical protein
MFIGGGNKDMKNPFTAHPGETDNPEGYWVHFHRAFDNGVILIWAGVTAIIHALFPWLYTFYTSETIIRLYWTTLHASGRHADLIEKWKPNNIKITECRTPSKYASPVIERYVPQAEPAEVESHPSHNWRPGNKGPRDEI